MVKIVTLISSWISKVGVEFLPHIFLRFLHKELAALLHDRKWLLCLHFLVVGIVGLIPHLPL